MEPVKAKMRVWLGDFPVVECKLDGITLNIGRNVHLTMHVGDFPHKIKPGEMLPLFTEIPYDQAVTTSVQ